MKFTCDTLNFSRLCSNVQAVATAKSTNPYTECLLIRTKEFSSVQIFGYDLSCGVRTTLDCDVEEEGAVVLNAKMFCEILNKLPGSRITFFSDERNVCTIDSGRAHFSIIGLDSANFPEMPEAGLDLALSVKQSVLRDMIKKTAFAVSTDEARAVHKGVKFEVNKGELRLVALDGYRLAVRSEFIEYNGDPKSFIVPGRNLLNMIRLFDDDDSFVNIKTDKNTVVFEAGVYNAYSDLLTGQFMNYEASIPKDNKYTVRIDTQKFLDSIVRTSILINEQKEKGPIKCVFDDTLLTITAFTSTGEALDELAVSSVGGRVEINFNSYYLYQAISAIETDEILILMNGTTSPALIEPVEGSGFLYMVLPVRPRS